MASILESVTGLLTPGVVGQISKAIGVDSSLVQTGLNAVGPTVLGSLAKSAGTAEGAASLFKTLSGLSGGGSDQIGGLINSLTGSGTDADVMQNMLGSGSNAITGTLARSLGFDIGPLMKIGLKAGDAAAALRKSFSDADWNKVRMAPVAATYLVTSVSPSGLRGTTRELEAAGGAVAAAAGEASPTSLVGMAFGGGMTRAELDRLSTEAPARVQALAVIQGGLAAVKAQSPGDATAYRNMILRVATRTAEAAKEGGLLGIGGTLVSAEEQAAIREITAALS